MRLQQKTALQKVGVMVRAGMMEPPLWYAAAKQVPPFHRRPSNGIEALQLPWDTLATEFISRNPQMVEDPQWLGPRGFQPGAPPISHVFAKRQFALMQNGIKKEDAYKRTHEAMKKERAEDVAKVQRMVKEASSMAGARPSFVSDDDVYSGLKFWQSMMQETPYSDWDLAATQGLDVFLRRELIGWDDDRVKLAQSARDGTAAALEAETNRLRVTLFPETKTVEYAFPSDVVRSRSGGGDADDADDGDGDGDGDDGSVYNNASSGDAGGGGGSGDGVEKEHEEGGLVREGSEEWKATRLNCGWKATLRRFEEMTEEAGYELDWSKDDRRSLDNFIVARCIRRSVLDEAFAWLPDPIAEALAKVNTSVLPGDDTKRDAQVGGSAAEGGGGERWISGAELEGFKGDWMALARRRTGRTASGASAAAAAAAASTSAMGRRRGDVRDINPVVSRPSMALHANLRAVLTQAKRQLLPDLVLEIDEKKSSVSSEERKAKDAARKKIVMSALEWEQEEMDEERAAVTDKLRAGMTVEEVDPIGVVRKKRLAKGTWKAERRRLLALEKKMYIEQKRAGEVYEVNTANREAREIVDDVLESEVVRRKANEFYAQEKARVKRENKLAADAVAASKA
ncbi:unnamed protein product [Pylaiella littoralis]